MVKQNKKLHYLFVLSICSLFLTSTVFAQSPTPTASNAVPSLIVPTSSITSTPIPTATLTPTPTPTPAPKVEIMSTGISVGTQYPWNKKIPVTLSIKPSQSGSKLEIRWQKKAGLVGSPTTKTILNPQAGKTYTVSFTLTPYAPGFQRAVADIILTTYVTNYVTSRDIPLQLDAKKTVIPTTSTYSFYLIGMYLVIFLMFFVVIPFALYQLYLYIKTHVIPKWLESKIQSPV